MSEINEIKKIPTPQIQPKTNNETPCEKPIEVNIFDNNGNSIDENPPSGMDKESLALFESFYNAFEEYQDMPESAMCPPMSNITPELEPMAPPAPHATPQPPAPDMTSEPNAPDECPPAPDMTSEPNAPDECPPAPDMTSEPNAPDECPPAPAIDQQDATI